MGRLLIALAAVLLLLSGCGSDPEPRFEADPTPSVAPSTPVPRTPTASVTPVAESPEDFIRRWQQASTDMQNTGDTEPFSALNAPSCEACMRLVSLVNGYYSEGGSVKARPWKIAQIDRQSPTRFLARITAQASTVVPSAGAEGQQSAGGSALFVFTLESVGDSWLVAEFAQRAS